MKKPKVQSPLKKGQRVYHATSSPDDFDMVHGPGWVSDNKRAVEFFSTWHGHSDGDRRPRILTFEVVERPKLVYIEDDRAWQDLLGWIEERFGEDVVGSGEIAEAICSAGGMDGWHIVNNYNPGSDTMLCDPERWLRLVEVEPLSLPARSQNPLASTAFETYHEQHLEGRHKLDWTPYRMEEAMHAAEKRFAVALVGPLYGCGTYGCAAPLMDGRVLKVTIDEYEARWARLTRRYQVPGMVQIDTSPVVVGLDDWYNGEPPEADEDMVPVAPFKIWAYVREQASDLPDPTNWPPRLRSSRVEKLHEGHQFFRSLGYELGDWQRPDNVGLNQDGHVVVRDGRVSPRLSPRRRQNPISAECSFLKITCDPPVQYNGEEQGAPLGWDLIERCSFEYRTERGDVRGEYLHTRSPDDEPSPDEQGEQLLIEQMYARPAGVGLGTEALRALRARYSTTVSGKTQQLPTVVLINIDTRDGLKLGRRGVEQGLVKVAIDRNDAIIATDADELFGPAEQSRIENPLAAGPLSPASDGPWLFRRRFTYALTRRPASTSTVPHGFVELGPATATLPFGTVTFERPLPRGEIEAFELEPLDPDDPIVLKRARQIYRDEVYEIFTRTHGFDQPDAEGGHTTLSYSTRQGVEYQVTFWLPTWTPTGHLDVNDFDEAVGSLWSSMPKAERRQRAERAVWRARRLGYRV